MIIPISEILIDYSSNTSRPDLTVRECEDLAISIGSNGLGTPVSVRNIEHDQYKYKLVRGFRRMMACTQILGYTEIRCDIDPGTTEENESIKNLIENFHRKDLNFWESCQALRRNFPENYTAGQIGRELNMDRGWVRNRWELWKFPEEVIDQISAGMLSPAQVNLLIAKTPEEQVAHASAIIKAQEEGETTESIARRLSGRRTVRHKKEIQKMMTYLLGESMMNEVQCLRYSIGEITDTQLMELLV